MIVGSLMATTENAAAYAADDGSFALNVHRSAFADQDGKPAWLWSIHVDGALLASGDDLNGWGEGQEMLGSLVSFLGNDAERYSTRMGPVDPSDDDYSFGERVAEWAYGVSEALDYAALVLNRGDE